MNPKKISGSIAAALAVAFAAMVAAQTGTSKPVATGSVAMPKTDRMTLAEFKRLLSTNEVVTVDVRSTDSYAQSHIPGALSIPEETITPSLAEKLKRMGKLVATYCT